MSSPPWLSSPTITTSTTTNQNSFGSTDFLAQQSPSSTYRQEQALTDDIFSLVIPSSETDTNTFPAFHNVFDTSASKPIDFNDVLQPTSVSTNKNTSANPLAANNQNSSSFVKPLQSGDLNSSLNQLIANLDIKDHSKIGKDHQWAASDPKSQQTIGQTTGTMNTSGTTWFHSSSAVNTPFDGMNVQPSVMPQVSPSMNNPFVAPSRALQMDFADIPIQSTGSNTNPFATQTIYDTALGNQQQIDNPFGYL